MDARSFRVRPCQRVMHRRCTARASLHSARIREPSYQSPSNLAAAVAVAVSLHVSAVVVSNPADAALETPTSPEQIVELVASGEVDEAELDALIKRFNDSRTGGNTTDTATAVSTSPSASQPAPSADGDNSGSATGNAPLASAARSINGGAKAFRYEPPPQKQGTRSVSNIMDMTATHPIFFHIYCCASSALQP